MSIMRIHFVGINGASMRVLSELCSSFGDIITGSDKMLNGHDKNNIVDADVIVYTNAVGENNEEVMHARKLGKIVVERAEFLGKILEKYKTVLAVAGTHGKTSTSGFLASIFESKNPTLHIGGQLLNDFKIVKSTDCIICESCEYRNSFFHIKSDIALILNMEFDHPDFFKDENDYIKSFQTFAENSNKVVVNENISHFFKNAITFGLSDNSNYFVKKIKETKTGVSFDVFHD